MSQESPMQNGPENKEMSQKAIDMLRTKMSAEKAPGVTQDDVDQAVKFLVQDAEKRGEPYTDEEVAAFNGRVKTAAGRAIEERLKTRMKPEAQVFDSTGEHLGSAASLNKAQDITKEARDSGR